MEEITELSVESIVLDIPRVTNDASSFISRVPSVSFDLPNNDTPTPRAPSVSFDVPRSYSDDGHHAPRNLTVSFDGLIPRVPSNHTVGILKVPSNGILRTPSNGVQRVPSGLTSAGMMRVPSSGSVVIPRTGSTNSVGMNRTSSGVMGTTKSSTTEEGLIRRPSSKLFEHYSKSSILKKSVYMVWENIELSVLMKDRTKSTPFAPVYETKPILHSLSGYAVSGELLAIMGPTGCGKTSLLSVLSARMPNGGDTNIKLTGKVNVNREPRNEVDFRKISALVPQDDRLYPFLTVHETLLIAAHFYLPHNMSLKEKEELVTSVIDELGLGKARNTMIGDEKVRGVSGGERKRVNIGVNLLTDPSVMFLDEPTSGLDSFQAQAVMESMKCMACHGRMVITVIHQPRSSIFDMFDKLLLLSEGRVMYHCDAHGAAKYFENAGFKCHKFFNPADFYLDILSPDHRNVSTGKDTSDRIEQLAHLWQVSSKPPAIPSIKTVDDLGIIPECNDDDDGLDDSDDSVVEGNKFVASKEETKENKQDIKKIESSSTIAIEQRKHNAEVKKQLDYSLDELLDFQPVQESKYELYQHKLRILGILFWRAWTNQTRNMKLFITRWIAMSFIAAIIGWVYIDMDDSQKDIRNRMGLLFMTIISMSFGIAMATLTSFNVEQIIVNRERASGAYDTVSYLVSKILAEIPLNCVQCLIFANVTCWMSGLNPSIERYFYYTLILLMHFFASIILGLCVSAFTSGATAGGAVLFPIIIVSVIFGGFYVNTDTLPIVANWIPYASYVKWTFHALCINEFSGQTFSCTGAPEGAGCLSTGEDVLVSMSFQNYTLGEAISGTGYILLILVFATLYFLMRTKLVYLPMGHIGKKINQYNSVRDGSTQELVGKDLLCRTVSNAEDEGLKE